MRGGTGRLFAAAGLATLLAAPAATAEPGEYAVKAAFLLNFARMVEWPEGAAPSSGAPFVICVRAASGVRDDIARTLEGKERGGHPVKVRGATNASEIEGCQMLFVSEEHEDPLAIAAARRHHVLSVGESDTFIPSGGIISFRSEAGKLRFDMHRAAAEEAGLKASSKLLRLAGLVEG